MNLKYVKNQTENSAEIFLYSPIGGGVNAQNFVSELQFLDSLGLDEINVRINSSGGSVIEGFGIFSAIRNAKTTVNTSIDGIAASIAGIIAQAGKKRTITDFGRLMIHDPSFAGQTKDKKAQAALDTIKASLVTILTNNSSLDEGEIYDLMTAETWFDAEEALAYGFAEEVTTTQREEATNELGVTEIENIANELFAPKESGATEENINQIKNDMLNVINHLGLNEEATQEEILDAVKTLENKVNEAEAALTEANDDNEQKVNELNETITNNDETIKTLTNEVALMVVENAIAAGKFSNDNKEGLVEKAIADLDGFKSIVNAVTVPAVSITAMIENEGEEVVKMTFNEMSKANPVGLKNMLKNDPEAYKKLYKKQFGVEPLI
jgi:ATP-dependent protease ClpP protease subunit